MLRQPGHRGRERDQQPVQARETELQLRLDAGDMDYPESRRRIDGVAQKRRLSDARLTRTTSAALNPRRAASSTRSRACRS
jgi:hypothetical protein